MNKNRSAIIVMIAIIAVSSSIIISGCIIAYAIKSNSYTASYAVYNDKTVMNLAEAADYLKLTEEDIQSIIQTEKNYLDRNGYFNGKMFPYYVIDEKQYFYKAEIDQWVQEATNNHLSYNTKVGSISN